MKTKGSATLNSSHSCKPVSSSTQWKFAQASLSVYKGNGWGDWFWEPWQIPKFVKLKSCRYNGAVQWIQSPLSTEGPAFTNSTEWQLIGWNCECEIHGYREWTILCVSRSVVSNSLQPHRWQPARLLCQWDSPGYLPNPGIKPGSPIL